MGATGMLQGSCEAVVSGLRALDIHGQISWEIVFVPVNDATGHPAVARLGQEAITGFPLEVGDTIQVQYLMSIVVGVAKSG